MKDSVTLFEAEASRHFRVLSDEEEAELSRRALRQDPAAINMLVLSNLKYAISVAKEYSFSPVPLGDLVQQAAVGLLLAARRYDRSRFNVRFISYARSWICRKIEMFIQDQAGAVRIAQSAQQALRLARKAEGKACQRLGRLPSPCEVMDEIDEAVKRKVEDLEDARAAHVACVMGRRAQQAATDPGPFNLRIESLDRPQSLDGSDRSDDRTGHEYYPSPGPSSDEVFELRMQEEAVNAAMARALNPREQAILRLCFGLDGEKEHTLTEVAQVLGGLSRERIRQCREAGLQKLRLALRAQRWKGLMAQHA